MYAGKEENGNPQGWKAFTAQFSRSRQAWRVVGWNRYTGEAFDWTGMRDLRGYDLSDAYITEKA